MGNYDEWNYFFAYHDIYLFIYTSNYSSFYNNLYIIIIIFVVGCINCIPMLITTINYQFTSSFFFSLMMW